MNKQKKPKIISPKNTSWKLLSGNSLIIFLAFVTIIGLVLRYYHLGFLSFWVDEYMHVTPAAGWLKGKPAWQGDNNGIFFTWVVIAFFKLFGFSELSARTPSVIFGTLSIPLIYFLAKKLFNKSIGTLSAALSAFSLYLIVWSRIARNYASFEFSFLILLIVFWLALNSSKEKDIESDSFLARNNLNKKYLIILPFAFIFSFVNHQLTFFFVFGASIYILYTAIKRIVNRRPKPFTNIYAILSYFIILGVFILFSPKLLEIIAKPILGLLLPERIITWVLPDWAYILKLFNSTDTRFACFMTYFNIIKDDYTLIYYLGIFGFIASFFNTKNKNGAVFLASMFLVPFLLMSFVFRNPCTPNYLFYIYPLFLISIASGVYFIVNTILPRILPNKVLENKWFNGFITTLILIGLFYSVPRQDIKSLITTKNHGQVTKKSLMHVGYVDWRNAARRVRPYVKDNDVIISTWVGATNWYLKRDNSIWFRQRMYDTKEKKYIYREATGKPNSAFSLDDLIRTYQNNKKGWLLADYYFDNVMTDPRARQFVIQNMNYHFGLSNGHVKVFSWDHNKPIKHRNRIIIDIGKIPSKLASKKMNFNISSYNTLNKMQIFIEAEGIDKPNEAFLIINDKYQAVFSATKTQTNNFTQYYDSRRQVYTFTVDKKWLKEGQNTFQAGYNPNLGKKANGFVIYNISFKNI